MTSHAEQEASRSDRVARPDGRGARASRVLSGRLPAALGGAGDAVRSSGQCRQALGGDRGAAALAPAVGSGAQALLSLLHRDQVSTGSGQQRRDLGTFERGRRSVGIVLVVGGPTGCGLHNAAQFAAERRYRLFRASSRGRQHSPRVHFDTNHDHTAAVPYRPAIPAVPGHATPPYRPRCGMGGWSQSAGETQATAGVCIIAVMGTVAVLEVDGQAVTIADPSGGMCDAAGNFDWLLPLDPKTYPILSRIDPWGEVAYGPEDMAAMLTEIDQLLAVAKEGPQRRGLLRLKALAEHGQDQLTSQLVVTGD